MNRWTDCHDAMVEALQLLPLEITTRLEHLRSVLEDRYRVVVGNDQKKKSDVNIVEW